MMWHLKGLGGGNEIETWPFWEYEYHATKLSEVLEKEKRARDGKDSGGSHSITDPRTSANRMMQDAQKSVKMPSVVGLKFPK